MAADRAIDTPASRGPPPHQRQILAADLARRERRDQPRVRLGRARDDQQPAGVLVEAVHESGARYACEPAIVREQRILQRVRAVAGARMHHQARRFVEHQQLAILVHDLERQRLGCDRGCRRRTAPAITTCSPPAHPVARPHRLAAHAHRALARSSAAGARANTAAARRPAPDRAAVRPPCGQLEHMGVRTRAGPSAGQLYWLDRQLSLGSSSLSSNPTRGPGPPAPARRRAARRAGTARAAARRQAKNLKNLTAAPLYANAQRP